MQIKRDKFVIESGAREADGTKIEPEAQLVKHVFEGTAPVGLGAGLEVGEPGVPSIGSMAISIEAQGSAQQVARSVSALCGNCKFFDRVGWLKMLAKNDGPGSTEAERHSIQAIRGEILTRMPDPDQNVGGDGDYDIEHAMKSMGLCHALREFYKGKDGKDPGIIGVWPTSGCPEETCSPDKPMGIYMPKDGDAARAAQANYDAVMQRAAGKIVGP